MLELCFLSISKSEVVCEQQFLEGITRDNCDVI